MLSHMVSLIDNPFDCNTFTLMFSHPLIIGRDYFIFSTWGLTVCTTLCFPVDGVLDMNSIALRVTPLRPGHALACLCVP